MSCLHLSFYQGKNLGMGRTWQSFGRICLPCGRNLSSVDISCGHTTDFYLGKTDLPRANSSKSPEVNSSRVLFYRGKNSGKVTLVISAPKVSTQVKFFGT